MQINFLFPHYGLKPGGGFRIIYQYADELSRKGHRINLIYPAYIKKGPRAIFGLMRTLKQLMFGNKWYKFQCPVYEYSVLNLKEKNIPDADVTIATACETAKYLNEYTKRKGKKIYFIQDYEIWAGNQDYVDSTWKYDMKKIVISKHLIDIGENMGVSDIELIANPINHELFRVKKAPETRELVVGMLYSKAERKGSKYGLQALYKLKEIYPDLRAILFGVGKRPKNIQRWIEYYQNPDQKKLVNEIYNNMMIFLCSSLYEGWGLPGMEAMACGVAVVSTSCGGVSNYAVHGETAILCELRDVEDLVKATSRLIEDKELRDKLIKNGLGKVADFSLEKSMNKFERVLMDV